MGSRSLCLVDAMVLVDGAKHGFLGPLLSGLAIGVAESALREVQYYRDDQGRKHPIDLTEPLDAGRLVMRKATAEELRQLLDRAVQRRLGQGELESLALVLGRDDDFCTAVVDTGALLS